MSEVGRRLVHLAGTALPGLYLLDRWLSLGVFDWWTLQRVLVALAALALALEALRLSGRVDWAVYDALTREYEQSNLAGYALYLVGMAGAAVLFVPRAAVPAMLMLTVGDPISGLLGSGGLTKRPLVLGAMFGVSLFIAVWFVPPLVAATGAATATLADGLKPVVRGYVIDDNLTIPLGAGLVLQVGVWFATLLP